MFRTIVRSALCAAFFFTPAAVGAEAILWKNIGEWEVSIDRTIRNGCYAVATWTGGTVLRIGLNPEASGFYMLIGNGDWASLKPGKPYELKIKFDDIDSPWQVAARGFQFNPGETVYLHAQSSKFGFIDEFMHRQLMQISYGGNVVDTLRLTGSSDAFAEVMACQQAMAEAGPPLSPTF